MNTISTNNFNSSLKDVQSDLFYFIFSILSHRQDAEDVLQKTNLILFKKQKTFNVKLGSFKNWALNIAKFQVMAHRTDLARSKVCLSNELTDIFSLEAVDYNTLEIKRNALNKCYKKLPKHMVEIAELRFKQDMSIKDISRSINRPIGAVSGTLYRIRENIKKCINNAYIEAEKEFYRY
jgi:RNA polymerase sigma-70 factor (ECF subfamily)